MSEEEREKYEAIIADMAKMLELQQKSEGVVIDMIAAAVKAEREACAKVCDEERVYWKRHVGWRDGAESCAKAIRARGEP